MLGKYGIDLFVLWPKVIQAHFTFLGVPAQRLVLDIDTNRTGDGVGYNQCRGCKKSLFDTRMDSPVEVSVAVPSTYQLVRSTATFVEPNTVKVPFGALVKVNWNAPFPSRVE